MIDTRYIYIGRTSTNRRLVKIGISKDVQRRWRTIDRSIIGSKEQPIACFRVINARWLETQLKRKYAHRRKQYKGSGKSEWYNLGLLARLWLYCTIAAHGALFVIACAVLVACIFLALAAAV